MLELLGCHCFAAMALCVADRVLIDKMFGHHNKEER